MEGPQEWPARPASYAREGGPETCDAFRPRFCNRFEVIQLHTYMYTVHTAYIHTYVIHSFIYTYSHIAITNSYNEYIHIYIHTYTHTYHNLFAGRTEKIIKMRSYIEQSLKDKERVILALRVYEANRSGSHNIPYLMQ